MAASARSAVSLFKSKVAHEFSNHLGGTIFFRFPVSHSRSPHKNPNRYFCVVPILSSLDANALADSNSLRLDRHAFANVQRGYSLRHATKVIPHPDKVKKGGEDAHFVYATRQDGAILGVFDGVGGWASEGVDPSEFSRSLERHSLEYARTRPEKERLPSPLDVLRYGYKKTAEQGTMGSSTACVLVYEKSSHKNEAVDSPSIMTSSLASSSPSPSSSSSSSPSFPHSPTKTGVLKWANLGDSGFLLIRGEKVHIRTKEQQHSFNCPFQLSSLANGDHPEDADMDEREVLSGDLLIVATDGLFDNLDDTTILNTVKAERVRHQQLHLQQQSGGDPGVSSLSNSNIESSSSVNADELVQQVSELSISSSSIFQTSSSAPLAASGPVSSATNLSSSLTSSSSYRPFSAVELQMLADKLATQANQVGVHGRQQGKDSPFAKNARRRGIKFQGGKLDDVTVIVAQF